MNIFSKIQKFKNKIALIDDKQSFTYNDVLKKINNLKAYINSKKLNFLICENSVDCFTIYIGLIRTNSKVFLISNKITSDDLNILIKKFKPDNIFKPISFLLKNKYKNKKLFKNYEVLISKKRSYEKIDNRVSVLISTSGSSGNAKFVALSKKNILSNTRSIVKYLSLKSTDQTITTLDLNYSYGFSILNTHIFTGASIVVTKRSLLEKEFWNIFKTKKITNISGVPSTYHILKRFKLFKNFNNKIRFMTAAGGKLDLETLKYFAKKMYKKDKNFYYMYGQTEASPRMSYIKTKDIFKNPQSIGKPISEGNFYLKDKNKRIIKKPYVRGILNYKGPNIMLGYVINLKDLESFSKINSLETGDIAYFNKNKFYFLEGRESRYIKVDYVRYNLDDLEKIISKKFKDVKCVGTDNLLKIFINKKLKNNENLEYFSRLTKIRVNYIKLFYIKKIPLLENGKYDYKYLNENFK